MHNSANNTKPSYFTIFHQNIHGIFHKVDELLYSIAPISPQVLCLTEHHLREDELKTMKFTPYTLGAHFCRQSYKHGGVSIYVSSNIQFYPIDLKNFNKKRDLEICALKIDLSPTYLIIVCIYRSPNGDFKYFINQLEVILNNIYKRGIKMILCGDFNINHFDINSRRNLLESLLASFNLIGTVTFPTRISINSSTLIDNIYIDSNSCKFTVRPIINGLSDHDAQVMELSDLYNSHPQTPYTFIRRIDNDAVRSFMEELSCEGWVEVFSEDDVNTIFTKFLDNYLKVFNANFPIIISKDSTKSNRWITTGIRISCCTKRNLYIKYRNSSDPTQRLYYKKYCKTLSSVIRAAKRMHYDSLIQKSSNKAQTTWNIVHSNSSF